MKHSIFQHGAALLAATALLTGPFAFAGEDGVEETEVDVSEYLERIELRSITALPGMHMFSLHDPENNQRFWIRIGETRHGIEAVAFDPEKNHLHLRHGENDRHAGLARGHIISGEEVPDREGQGSERQQRQTERVERQSEREARQDERDQWRDLRERLRTVAENSPEIEAISERFTAYREEMRTLGDAMSAAERGSEEFVELRGKVDELLENYSQFQESATETLMEHPDFDEADARRMLDRSLETGPRRRVDSNR